MRKAELKGKVSKTLARMRNTCRLFPVRIVAITNPSACSWQPFACKYTSSQKVYEELGCKDFSLLAFPHQELCWVLWDRLENCLPRLVWSDTAR